MKNFSQLIFMIFLGAIAFSAPAESGTGAHGSHWVSIIDDLKKSGITHIGDFQLGVFRVSAGEIQWRSIQGDPGSVLSGSRKTAYYLWRQKQVYINDSLPSEALASVPQLELHEALGATGYNDRDYALSTAITTLSKMADSKLRRQLVDDFGHSLFQEVAMSDGGSSVTGGGDLSTLYAKVQVLKLIMGGEQNRYSATREFLRVFPSIGFEPVETGKISEVVIQYEYLGHSGREGSRERFSVFLPMKRWRKSVAERESIVREIARKVLEIFPGYRGEAMSSFTPSYCSPSVKKVSYPVTLDLAVRNIQNFRGALQLGCRNEILGQDFAIIAPALERADSPKQAGNFYFACEFRYGAAKLATSVKITAGEGNERHSTGWRIDEGDFLLGTVALSKAGKILWTTIQYTPPSGERIPFKVDEASSPDHGKSEISVHGRALSFSCRKEG